MKTRTLLYSIAAGATIGAAICYPADANAEPSTLKPCYGIDGDHPVENQDGYCYYVSRSGDLYINPTPQEITEGAS